jgi:predicted short-subunit dehydrogenase-like oxidoreductase (DUF2520 family)
MYAIALIGSGNLAWHLGQALYQSGNTITEVFSQHWENAQQLATILGNADPKTDLDFSQSKAQIFFLAVKDDVLERVIAALHLPNHAILAHTSGTQPLEIIQKQSISPAVFYPLQTFTKAKQVNFAEIPICIEATDEQTYQTLEQIAQSISTQIDRLGSKQRQVLHLAAVFSCNFSNFLLTISKEILEKEKLSFDLLKPLVNETIAKAYTISPAKAQTGPAKRGDNQIIQKHLTLLEEMQIDENWQEIYKQMSEAIMNFYTDSKH